MKIIPYQAEHLLALSLQPSQQWLSAVVDIDKARTLEQAEFHTAIEGRQVLLIAGVVPIWQGRGFAVAFVSDEARKHWLPIHRAARRWLDAFAPRRLEAAVAFGPDFERECRWLERLGFTVAQECARAFQEDGTDCRLYERIRAD